MLVMSNHHSRAVKLLSVAESILKLLNHVLDKDDKKINEEAIKKIHDT
jgi:hypothetical protein